MPDAQRAGRRMADHSTIICFRLCIFWQRSAGITSGPPWCCHLLISIRRGRKHAFCRASHIDAEPKQRLGRIYPSPRLEDVSSAFSARRAPTTSICPPALIEGYRQRNRLQKISSLQINGAVFNPQFSTYSSQLHRWSASAHSLYLRAGCSRSSHWLMIRRQTRHWWKQADLTNCFRSLPRPAWQFLILPLLNSSSFSFVGHSL